MNEAPTLVLAWVAGAGLGAMFFGGLWWTVRRGISSARPAAWFLGSLLLRTSVALAGFYAVSGGHWQPLLACLLGFFMARLAAARLARPSGEPRTPPAQGAGRAP
jgi:F1F0 ATPase subunit 2